MLTPDMEKDWMESRDIKVHEWTGQEKKWLEERSKPDYPAACTRRFRDGWKLTQKECKRCPYNERPVCFCPLSPDYRDAAEFSERVAALMAQPNSYTGCHQCYYSHEHKCSVQMHKGNIDFRWCLLKFRRIAVEEMMEEE